MIQNKTQVLVIGAGYAGLLATMRLAMKSRNQDIQITLVNSSDIFIERPIERPRLHQFATNQQLKQQSIPAILNGTRVQFIKAVVTTLDINRREVIAQTDTNNQRLNYDYLLYTAGSIFDQDRIPGIREYAYTLSPTGPRSAVTLRSVLPELNHRRGRLVIVGGGPTGIESAAEFAESYPGLHVSLVTQGKLGELWGGKIQSHIQETLARFRVSIRDQTIVEQIEQNAILTKNGESIPFNLCLWAGGFVAPPLAGESGLAMNEHGQLLTDLYMRSISNPFIYAAGDCAQPAKTTGVHVRMAAYTATITGAHAADCLYNAIIGASLKPLNFAYLGQGITLGRSEAVAFNNFPDDQPKWPILTGQVAIYGREFFVNLLADFPKIERRLPGLHFWPIRGKAKIEAGQNVQPGKRESRFLK